MSLVVKSGYVISFFSFKLQLEKRLFSSYTRTSTKLYKMSRTFIAVCQMTSKRNKEDNFKIVERLTKIAAQREAKMVFFPEATDFVADNKQDSYNLAEPIDGELMKKYKLLAQENNIWISFGFHEKSNVLEDKLMNSHVIVDSQGDIRAVYRKLHLFDVSIPEKNLNLQESEYVHPGQELLKPLETPAGLLGLSICYDLRFPEVSTLLREKGADILTYPSAFTTSTGKAHWKVLLQARAIENQCYVLAPAQYGQHNDKRVSYGNSMIVDPWGTIVAESKQFDSNESSDDEDVIFAEVDQSKIKVIRKEMPVFNHRRNDIYNLNIQQKDVPRSIDDFKYKFAHIDIPSSTVFYRTKYSYAFTNLRCVVPGHVLVSSLRFANRLNDLKQEERDDFFKTVVDVQRILEFEHGTNSSTICIQDGKNAGQTIPHVHCHILPRKVNDFEKNDDIYEQLAKHDRENSSPPRSLEEMTSEASILRRLFTGTSNQM